MVHSYDQKVDFEDEATNITQPDEPDSLVDDIVEDKESIPTRWNPDVEELLYDSE